MLGERRVSKSRVGSLHQPVLVRVPEIDVRLIVLRIFLLFSLNRGQTFLFLISHACGFSGFATDQECKDPKQPNELKLFHT
jgi:hypothetical protein